MWLGWLFRFDGGDGDEEVEAEADHDDDGSNQWPFFAGVMTVTRALHDRSLRHGFYDVCKDTEYILLFGSM